MDMRGNVRFITGDAADIDSLFGAESICDIYANFSDPWTKNSQCDRRLTAPGFLNKYFKILVSGGSFRFKTDNVQLFEYSLDSVRSSDFELAYFTRDLHASEKSCDNIETEYEKNFSAKGFKINYLEAVKK